MGNVIQIDWGDILRTEGINAKGYGILPKYPMIDTDLSLTAKTIYAYLCSLSGNGESTYPAIETIKSHLGLGQRAYDTHFKQLIESGYVIKKRQRTTGNRFSNNLYILASNPKKFVDQQKREGEDVSKIVSRICVSGLKSVGYGTIPRTVMCDSRLPYKAKGIYAYFASFTGAGNVAFPTIEQITRQLNINKDTYYKYIKELINLNYITVEQLHDKKGFAHNQYYLNDKPEEAIAQTEKKFKTVSDVLPKKSSMDVFPKNVHTETMVPKKMSPVKENPVKQVPENVDAEKVNTTNNTYTINTLTNNSPYNQQINLSLSYRKKAKWIDSFDRNELKNFLYDWYDVDPNNYQGVGKEIIEEVRVIRILVDKIINIFLDKSPYYAVKDEKINRGEYISSILALDPQDLYEIIERIIDSSDNIQNPTAYIITCLYNAARDKVLLDTECI